MQNKKKIIAEHKKLLNIIKKHNENYFIHDNPKITDSEYDQLKVNILKLEDEFLFLKKHSSIENIIGSKLTNKFKKVKHLSPMLSLSNAFDLNDMKDFQKVNNFLLLKDKQLELFCEPKIDGISATLIYENGILTKGLSRGDGIFGEDILENLKTIKDLPKKIISKMFQAY